MGGFSLAAETGLGERASSIYKRFSEHPDETLISTRDVYKSLVEIDMLYHTEGRVSDWRVYGL